MAKPSASPLLFVAFLLLLSLWLLPSPLSPATAAAAASERVKNKSAVVGGLQWATGKDEGDLLAEIDSTSDGSVGDGGEELAGGFSSLDSMLQWAIAHSDPEELKDRADDVRRLSVEELQKRQLELKELMERLKMPSDAELMKIAIADLNNFSISTEDRMRALNELLILVEPIDNSNDLDKLGGLVALIQQLDNMDDEVRTTAAWVIGKASQNNALVQNQVLAYGALARLMKMVYSTQTEEAVKALYAVSALIRNNEKGQELFDSENGKLMLQYILATSADTRLQKKAAFLIADLADFHLSNSGICRITFFDDLYFLKSLVDLASSSDLDLRQKVLMAIRSLLLFDASEATTFRDSGLKDVLQRMAVDLEQLALQEDRSEYAGELEDIRAEIQAIFQRKLKQVTTTPT